MKTQRTMNEPVSYEIRVAGHMSENWAARFEGLSLRNLPEGETVISGMLDQAALHGVFVKIRDLGLNLISVNRITEKNSSQIEEGKWVKS
jgi:hypothetical protein